MSPLEIKIATAIENYQKAQSDYFREHQKLRSAGVWIPFRFKNTDDMVFQAVINEVKERRVVLEVMYLQKDVLRVFVSNIEYSVDDNNIPMLELGEWTEIDTNDL